jgi:mono/diheme cytochrome c family protein
MRRPAIALLVILVGLGLFASGLAWVLDTPRPPSGASRIERLYLGLCATCHGADGHGSWRARVFLIRPGDLADAARMRGHSDQYLADIIKQGGAPLGRPGMPAFGASLSDDDIRALVAYLRRLATRGPRDGAQR